MILIDSDVLNMQSETEYPDPAGIEIVSSRVSYARSELEKFAIEFEPGYFLRFPDFREGARMYIGRLPSEQKENLRRELNGFIRSHQDKSLEELKVSWLKAGAMEWPRNQDMREVLRDILQILES